MKKYVFYVSMCLAFMKFTVEEFLAKLPLPADEKWRNGVPFTTAFKKGNVSVEFFAPRGTDYQTFHEEDEFYFIVRGSGELIIENERYNCEIGDAFFVPAKAAHHFENFTDGFATWAIFF